MHPKSCTPRSCEYVVAGAGRVLEPDERWKAFNPDISVGTRFYVLLRDRSTCQICGAIAAKPHPRDRTLKTKLRVIKARMSGDDEPDNLISVCWVCIADEAP